MAILKHLVNKNADYGATMKYLLFEHDEKDMKPILDDKGRMVLRREFLLDGVNCEPYSFDKECEIVNEKYHKNKEFSEIKSHHYIISFDPEDKEDRGLTGEKLKRLHWNLSNEISQVIRLLSVLILTGIAEAAIFIHIS